MTRESEIVLDVAPWVAVTGREILRIGHSGRVIGKIIPDILRVIVETSQLELVPKAALYLNDAATEKAKLAGFHNSHWSQFDTTLDFCNEFHAIPDKGATLTRILVPVAGPGIDPMGTLVFHVSTSGDYEHRAPLAALAADVATVVRAKLRLEEIHTAANGTMIVPIDSRDGSLVLSDRVFELLRTTIDSFPGGVCVLGGDLTVVMTNQRLYEILELPEALFLPGCNFADVLRFCARRGEYGPGDIEELAQQRIRHAKLFVDHAFDRETASGLVLEVRTTPMAGGGAVVTYLDVTARKNAERELMRHRDRLEDLVSKRTAEIKRQSRKLEHMLEHERHVNEQQRQFVAMASHEFRTPLAIIDGAAQRLIRNKAQITPDFVGHKVEQIRGSVSRMVDLMESILAVGRLDHGVIDVRSEPFAIGDLIRLCVANQTRVTPDCRFRLDIENLPETINADRSGLQQVFTNLFSNAVKYAPNSPEIFVRGWCDGGQIHVSVKDQGVGIDADDLPKMFQRYFRARTSTGIAGTGIGLNLVQQIVELHNGTISVESEKDQGTIFTVTLPHDVQDPASSDTSNIEAA